MHDTWSFTQELIKLKNFPLVFLVLRSLQNKNKCYYNKYALQNDLLSATDKIYMCFKYNLGQHNEICQQ